MSSRSRSVNGFHVPSGYPPSARGPDWDAWLAMYDALSDPDAELLIEDFAPFYAMFLKLRRLGVPYSPDFCRRMESLNSSGINTDDDGDADGTDEAIDLEDSDEDLSVDDEGASYTFSETSSNLLACPRLDGFQLIDPQVPADGGMLPIDPAYLAECAELVKASRLRLAGRNDWPLYLPCQR